MLLLSAQIVFLIIFALFSIFAFFFFISVFTGAPYVGTPAEKIAVMLRLAAIKKGTKVIDLGSGDGRLVVAAARRGAWTVGVEINPGLWIYSNLKLYLSGRVVGKASFLWGSLFEQKFSDYEVIFVAGFVEMMKKLEKRFTKELKKRTKVICYAFPLPNKKASYSKNGVYLYKY